MKRFVSALALCLALLFLLSVFLFPPTLAKDNVLQYLLDLPAPPPPNPLVTAERLRDKKFYDKEAPPKDNAPIDEILDYWKAQNGEYRELGYNVKPSDRVAARIMAEIEKKPALLPEYLNILTDDETSANFVKELFEREGTNGAFDRGMRGMIKKWLTYHTAYYSSDLARIAEQAGDANQYVSNQEELLALTRVDYDKARPIIDRLANDSSQKASQVLAKWARYRHALDSGSTGDVEQYRDELKAVVEDKSATPGMRDLALDALCKEKDFSGRDDWYYSLLGDETLADLKVNGQTYTGLTTILYYAPDDKYIEKMLEFVKSDNPVIRAAAIRNLVLKLSTKNPEIIKALLPWLEDPKWAVDLSSSRSALVSQLGEFEIPESVPGLIKIIDEKQSRTLTAYSDSYGPNVNSAARAANAAAYAANYAVNRPAANYKGSNGSGVEVAFYPYRDMGVIALAKQKDMRAGPPLRRLLPESEGYQQGNVIRALLACHGFTVTEQMDALEAAAKHPDGSDGAASNAAAYNAYVPDRPKSPPTAAEIREVIGRELMNSAEITDDLARAIVDRIEVLDKNDKPLGALFRKMILRWQNAAINILLLRDVKRGIADSDTIVRLLAQKKVLRETQSADVFDIRTGTPIAVGTAACLLNDEADAQTILDNGDAETRTALLACARLIRMPLPIAKVAEDLKSTTPILVTAAERYLESEDSPEARTIVLSRHPGEAKIMGARSAFFIDGVPDTSSETLYLLYQSLGDDSLYNGWYGSSNDDEIAKAEKQLQDEVKKDADLMGVYAYERNYVRIYKDRVIFSWDEDDARYRERPLTKYEFDEIKAYIASSRLDELPPFLSCGGDYCMAKELVMLGKAGGRRVYVNGGPHDVFTGLEKLFADLKLSPSKLKYTLSRDIPGLEIVLASDQLHAETVWKDGTDLRIAASERAVREKVNTEIENADGEVTIEDIDQGKIAALVEKRKYEGFSWYKIAADGTVEGSAAQPPDAEFIPVRDGLGVQVSDAQWKARAAGIEIRTSDDGIFKVARGKLIKLRSGSYSDAVVTPDGRWAVVHKADPEGGDIIVRVDLSTGKEFATKKIESYGRFLPAAYIATLNKVLVVRHDEYDGEYYRGDFSTGSDGEDDTTPPDADPEAMYLVDPATGSVQPIAGEFRPIAQQTFRSLQKTSKPNEYWAAISDPEKNETQVGTYETKTFGFKPLLKLPRINFNSMNLWVDEPGAKVYFVYRGHLLALPLGPVKN